MDNLTSLEVVKHHHLYPLPEPVFDDEALVMEDLVVLPGEGIVYVGKTLYGPIILTNYRVFIMEKDKVVARIPKYAVMKTENIDFLRLKIICKTGASFVLAFDDHMTALKWLERLSILVPSKLDNLIACHFHAYIKEKNIPFAKCDCPTDSVIYNEFRRMKFDEQIWKITDVNKNFQICPTYPEFHIIPRCITDSNLKAIAAFRTLNRFPSVVWRSLETGAVLLRCAQPCVGIMSWRSTDDEKFVKAVRNSCAQNSATDSEKRLLIVDARNYSAAQLNRIKGGGFEFVEYYDRTDITFMSLPNIHSVRDSFEKLIVLYSVKSDVSWFGNIEKTNWLQNLSLVIKSSVDIVQALHQLGRPVMVHCTDGWDRTPQLTSLAQILLDPYYRTFKGFRILVEREWLSFGHKFGDRCGHGVNSNSLDERSPIFLQWLDCVFQLSKQYPKAFEFNETYLVKLSVHVYSTMFGTFLCNSLKERVDERLLERACCLWTFLSSSTNAWQYKNYLYDKKANNVLFPSFLLRDLVIWKSVYVNTFCPQFSHFSNNVDSVDSSIENESKEATSTLNSSLNGSPCMSANAASLRRSHSTDDIYSSLNNIAPNNTADCKCDDSSPPQPPPPPPPLHCPNPPGAQYRESSVPATSTLSLREIDMTIQPNYNLSNNSSIVMQESVCSNYESAQSSILEIINHQTDDEQQQERRQSPENCSYSPADSTTSMESVGQLASSTDTLTETAHLPISNSVSAATYKPITNGDTPATISTVCEENVPKDHSSSATVEGEFSPEIICESVPSMSDHSVMTPLYVNSLEYSATKVEEELGYSVNNGDYNHYEETHYTDGTTTSEMKAAANNNMELPRSLGYGTSSDFSTPYSSGPSTPDNVDQTPSWHQTYFRRATGHSVSSSGSDSFSDNNTITRKTEVSTLSSNGAGGDIIFGENNAEECCDTTTTTTANHNSRFHTATHTTREENNEEDIIISPCRSPTRVGGNPCDTEQDEDGLPQCADHVTRHIHSMMREFQQQKAALERKIVRVSRELQRTRLNNRSHEPQMNDHGFCGAVLVNDVGQSLDRMSNISTGSDTSSFDMIDESESHIVRWVPDQHAHSCHLCTTQFNWNIRKHHCRKCGNVFCDTCSNFNMPVPDQMCHEPTRVCKSCYLNATVMSSFDSTSVVNQFYHHDQQRQHHSTTYPSQTTTSQASARA